MGGRKIEFEFHELWEIITTRVLLAKDIYSINLYMVLVMVCIYIFCTPFIIVGDVDDDMWQTRRSNGFLGYVVVDSTRGMATLIGLGILVFQAENFRLNDRMSLPQLQIYPTKPH